MTFYPYTSNTSAYQALTVNTWDTITTTGSHYPMQVGRLVLDDVAIEQPEPLTEIDLLMREIEEVCALAR